MRYVVHSRAIGPGKYMLEAPFVDFGFVCFACCHDLI